MRPRLVALSQELIFLLSPKILTATERKNWFRLTVQKWGEGGGHKHLRPPVTENPQAGCRLANGGV